MLQHLFYVMIGFDPNAKWFEILFENAFGKSNWKNEKEFLFILFLLLPIWLVGPFPSPRPARSPALLAWPAHSAKGQPLPRLLPLCH
jgi:hypothetical protein